ncbi:MAG: hypothetical protein C5B50_19770 [Verrucomicrobia bacterium]|nr:MAG: hypothetical protein C5B50_19770 [Verrucomicrobiota bacterium]
MNLELKPTGTKENRPSSTGAHRFIPSWTSCRAQALAKAAGLLVAPKSGEGGWMGPLAAPHPANHGPGAPRMDAQAT